MSLYPQPNFLEFGIENLLTLKPSTIIAFTFGLCVLCFALYKSPANVSCLCIDT